MGSTATSFGPRPTGMIGLTRYCGASPSTGAAGLDRSCTRNTATAPNGDHHDNDQPGDERDQPLGPTRSRGTFLRWWGAAAQSGAGELSGALL